MNTYEIPKSARKIINEYRHLELGGKKVRCPYYMNLKRAKDLRAMVGKGTPEEIIMEAKIWEKLKGENFNKMSEKEIREFLVNRGIGVDCSGFVVHVLNKWFKDETGKSIWSELKIPRKNLLAKLSYRLKPVEKLGAEIITNSENSKAIKINDVIPGDVIRTKWKRKNSHHILLVTKVETHQDGNVKTIEYTHSIPFYQDESGIKKGEIEITDYNKPLKDQNWTEKDKQGINHVYEGFLIQENDNGLRRIKALKKLQKNLRSEK